MLSALISAVPGHDVPPLSAHLKAAGLHVLDDVACTQIAQAAIKTAPDVVICYDPCPDPALFANIATLMATAPTPVVLFTSDPDAGRIEQALNAGVSAYIVDGYYSHRLRAVIHVAMARFRYDQARAVHLAELQRRFVERTLVDRAKGILMGARQLREEEAYRALRTAAMHAKQRIGQVARLVIDSAHYAEAINRAGQFRMLSQRLVKLYALTCAEVDPPQTSATFVQSVEHTDGNLAALTRTLSVATFGDLLDGVAKTWSGLKAELVAPPDIARLESVNLLANDLLARAESLTNNLEITGLAAALHVINVAGRQRMLSQRLAKEALLSTLLDGSAGDRFRAAMTGTRAEFTHGLEYLTNVPLRSVAIQAELDEALGNCLQFDLALERAACAEGRLQIAICSEKLLANFDRLTGQYEIGMQALTG